jgi:polysaccharide biosynthesis transport protein
VSDDGTDKKSPASDSGPECRKIVGRDSAAHLGLRPRRDVPRFLRAAEREGQEGVDLFEYWRLLRRRRGTLVLAIGVGMLVAVLVTLPQTPVYQAKTSLELLNLNEDFMNMKDVEQAGDEQGYNLLTDVETQIKILESDRLLNRVLGEMAPAGSGELVVSRISSWRKLLNLPPSEPADVADPPLAMAKREVKVHSVGQTRIMELTVDSTNPKVAADFANRWTQDYIEDNVQSRWEMTQKTGDFLTRQIDDMRSQLERSEDLMQTYARRNGLVFTDEKTNVAEVRLKDLQDELSKAQADRVTKQSRWELATTAAPETLPDVLNDPTLREFQEKLADLKREKAALEETFTPDYPQVKRLAAQADAVSHSLQVQQDDILKQIKNEYDSAMRREVLLQSEYRNQAGVVSDQSEKSIQYNILKREVDTNRQLYESMLQHVKEASVAGALRASNVRVIDPATVPKSPYKPELWLNSLVGLLAGALFGAVYVAATEKADRMLQEPADIGIYMGLPELGVIPAGNALRPLSSGVGRKAETRSKEVSVRLNLDLAPALPECLELVTWQAKPGPLAESFRAALTSILFSGRDGRRPGALVITSPNPGDGKTTVATNLAIALAETGKRVLLIDGDMRKPRIHALFGFDNDKGLSGMLQGSSQSRERLSDREIVALCRATPIPGCFVLPSGPSDGGSTNLLHSKHLPGYLRTFSELFDMVLLDSPPMLAIPDARLLGKLAGGVVLVVRAQSTTRDAAIAARMRLEEDGIEILGTILNDWDPKQSRGGYYGYYSGSYQNYFASQHADRWSKHD